MVLKAGVGRSDITPEAGLELSGYSPFLERKSTGIHDSLFCKALILESGEEKGLFVVCDLIGTNDSLVEKIRRAISAKFPIKPEKIIVSAIHTHSGPATGGYIGWGEEDKNYTSNLPELILSAVKDALGNLKEVNVGLGHFPIKEEIGYNRVQPEKGVNREVGLVKIVEKESGRPVVFLVNYGLHGVVQGQANTLISRDWIGEAVDVIGDELGAETIFLQGACGDINVQPAVCKDPEDGFRQIERVGKAFPEFAVKGFKELNVKEVKKFSFNRFFIDLPCNPTSKEELTKIIKDNEEILKREKIEKKEERNACFQIAGARIQVSLYEKGQADFVRAEVQVIEIDNGLIITLPVELFSEFGHSLKRGLPGKEVFVVAYTNGVIGYIPSLYDFENKLYASNFVPRICGNMPFRKDVGEVLVKEILAHFPKP